MYSSKTIERERLCRLFDHTNLKPYATKDMLRTLCEEAAANRFAIVAINSSPVAFCKGILKGSGVNVGAAISFPLGQTTIEAKLAETEKSIADGADEIDYVINIGELKDGNTEYVRKEMDAIVSCCRKCGVLSKVIFEICYLAEDEIRTVAEIANDVEPDFIKTSTGFGTSGATVEAVRLMRKTAKESIKIKASGGIRDWSACAAMIDTGAERIGTSNSLKILDEFDKAR